MSEAETRRLIVGFTREEKEKLREFLLRIVRDRKETNSQTLGNLTTRR